MFLVVSYKDNDYIDYIISDTCKEIIINGINYWEEREPYEAISNIELPTKPFGNSILKVKVILNNQ